VFSGNTDNHIDSQELLMKIRYLSPFASAIGFLLSATFACADSLALFDGTGAVIGSTAGALNIGREFNVYNPITVDDLGVFDYGGNGLVSAHDVTLFQLSTIGASTGTPIATVHIPAGTNSTLDKWFRYQPITPMTLNPGAYAVVAYGLNKSADPYGEANGINPNPSLGVIANGGNWNFTTAQSPTFPYQNYADYGFNAASFHYTSSPLPTMLKIMPLGDSITDGVGGTNAGYRGPLYSLLSAKGMATQFVGSATNTPGVLPAMQQLHEGHSGYTITGGGRAGIMDNIKTWLGPQGADPDVILLMIGTNDVTTYATSLSTIPQATANLDALISKISNKSTGLKPNAKLILAEITPIENASQDALAKAYNASIVSLVAAHQSLGENVSLVDMHSALNNPADMNDNLHPNSSGYNKMAQVWFNGIIAVVPEPSSIVLLIAFGLLGLCILGYKTGKRLRAKH
jgi:lysophospholipase L1-like esterase